MLLRSGLGHPAAADALTTAAAAAAPKIKDVPNLAAPALEPRLQPEHNVSRECPLLPRFVRIRSECSGSFCCAVRCCTSERRSVPPMKVRLDMNLSIRLPLQYAGWHGYFQYIPA